MNRIACLLPIVLLLCSSAHGVAESSLPIVLTNAPSSLANVFQLAPGVLSGSVPDGDEAFAWLAARGVKTVLSVDGARPDIETARRHGLRYVHLPIGYDGVPPNRMAELATVRTALPGSIYVHCHHGKHRGPAAAAILCRASESWTASQAEAFLKQAGTSPEYPGLFSSVRDFQLPDQAALSVLPGSFPEIAEVGNLTTVMVRLDEQLERLQACQRAGWQSPPDHPDVTPAHEAVQLWEQLHEFGRSAEAQERSASFLQMLQRSERDANALRHHLAASQPDDESYRAQADSWLSRVTKNCAACHQQFRN